VALKSMRKLMKITKIMEEIFVLQAKPRKVIVSFQLTMCKFVHKKHGLDLHCAKANFAGGCVRIDMIEYILSLFIALLSINLMCTVRSNKRALFILDTNLLPFVF
jgi:hypothetical protein